MHMLHRSAKRLLLHRACSLTFTGLSGLPLHAFHYRFLLEEPAQKNIINKFTRHFPVLAENYMHETNQQEGRLLIDVNQDVYLSQRMHTVISEERKCKVEHSALELAGGSTTSNSVTHVDDCARTHTHVDDSVSTCVLASQKECFCNVGNSELVVAEAGTISHRNNKKRKPLDSITSEVAEANFLSQQKEGNRQFDGSASEVAIINSCKASGEHIKHFDSSIRERASDTVQTMKFPSRGKQQFRVNDSRSEFSSVCEIKSMSRNCTGELVEKERLKQSADNTETGLQREDVGLFRIKGDAKTSRNGSAQERTCDDVCGFFNGVSDSKKVDYFTMEQGIASRPCEREYCAVQKKINKKKKKKKKKNTNRQFEPEDLDHLSLTLHPFPIAAAGEAPCKEKPKKHGENSHDDNFMQSKIIPPVTCRKCPGYVDSKDSISMDALKLNDREKRESVDAIFTDRRQVNQGISNGFVEKNQKSLACENSSKSRLNQVQKSGKSSKHMKSVEQSNEGEKEPFKNQSWEVELIDKGASLPTRCVGNRRSVHSTMKPHMCKENEAESEASGYSFVNRGKTISYNQIKGGTSLDPPSSFWERVRTIAPVETIECGAERAEWDLEGVRKAHYSLRNYRELYIILDLNGVLIKRWDKNPSLPGVSKLNKKWIQLRPGCIEFLQKAFSSFRVGIWSTMTQKNVLSMCNFLEQQAHQSLPFFMLWSKDSCYQHRGVRRPNKANVVADFKPLSRVWGYFKPFLGFHNTVLVDDSPYKACMNNPYNCIFPDAFEGYTDDKFLTDVLWPYLEKMRMSHNIQAYIANNPLGQPPVVVGHELYHHVHQVMGVFDYCASPPIRAP